MKTHTNEFKNKIKEFGREIDSKITYTISGTTTELGPEQLNSVSPHYQGAILKSVMKQLDIDSNIEIPIGAEINYKFGIKTRSGKNILNFNDFLNTANSTYTKNNNTYTITSLGSAYSTPYVLNLKLGTTYTLSQNYYAQSGATNIRIDMLKNGSVIGSSYATNQSKLSYTFPTQVGNVYSIRINFSSGSPPIYLDSIMLEESTSPTSYEDYGAYDYIDYGNYIVKDVEKQEDTYSYKITCYDKMLYAMKDYENSNITFPITIKNYLIAICGKIGLTFQDSNFANYDKTIDNELYLDNDGNSLNYTFRDVLDEIAQVSGGTICISDDDKLEVRYINQTVGKNLVEGSINNYAIGSNGRFASNNDFDMHYAKVIQGKTYITTTNDTQLVAGFFTTIPIVGSTSYNGSRIVQNSKTFIAPITGYVAFRSSTGYQYAQLEEGTQATEYEPYGDTIDEEYLKDVNVNFGEKFGPVNTIVLSRGGDGDKISLSQPTNLPDADKIAIQISDNQIMNGNDRDTYLSALLNKLYGLEYYINDFSSTGICYLDLCDKYNIKVGDKFYSCIMLNDNVNITQGLEELIYTDMQEENEQEYKYIGSTDRGITQANIIANKAEATITSFTQQLDATNNRLNSVEIKQTATDETINIISTNIDANGNITEVTTTTGFTFNADGMTIADSQNNFSALHRNDGTYYYDGNTIVGQYTKDGSKQKDLQLFGVYYYGMSDENDTPMFVAQLFTDTNGNEAFGHFYNRGN